MRLPRMTTRRWMVLVAIAGVVFAVAARLYQREIQRRFAKERLENFIWRSRVHAAMDREFRLSPSDLPPGAYDPNAPPSPPDDPAMPFVRQVETPMPK
jgi:hypothetical protein